MIMGHLHSDEFFLLPFYNATTLQGSFSNLASASPVAVVLNTPSLSPIFSNNPSFRVLLYNKSNHMPLEYLVHHKIVAIV